MTQQLLGWGLTPQALTNVTPFTYRDNATYIQLMQDVRDKVNELISVVNLNAGSEATDVAAINATYTSLVAQWNATLATLDPTQVSALVTTLTANVTTALNNAATALATATSASSAVAALDTTLTAALAAETAARSDAITAAVLVETTARTTADTTEAATRAADDATEATARAAADTAETAARVAADAAFMPSPSPSWCTRVKNFDSRTGAYNVNPQTMAKFRTAKALATYAGYPQTPLHISVLGDSITSTPNYVESAQIQSWPSRMRDYLLRNLGFSSAGTGIIGIWNLFGGWACTDSPAYPEYSFVTTADGGGFAMVTGYGIYGNNTVQINSGATAPYTGVKIIPNKMVDEFWLYMATTGTDSFVDITDGTTTHSFQIPAYYGATITSPVAGYTAATLLPGYEETASPSVNGGFRVTKLSVPAQDNWTALVHSHGAGSVVYLMMFEAKLSSGTLRVSNLAQGGMSLSGIFAANNGSIGGLSNALDAPQADLAIIALGINDWQGHVAVADYKSYLTQLVQRQKLAGAVGQGGTGVAANGDVLLFIPPLPDFTRIPVDHVQIPTIQDYWTAVYQVADEQNVGLIDLAWRWTDYASSVSLYNDGSPIHPNQLGHADIGILVGEVLASV